MFGELALLYNVPRAATITAIEKCVLWSLDRETFNNIVKDAAMYIFKLSFKGNEEKLMKILYQK
jgi:CRP-like cAMP-binding protein